MDPGHHIRLVTCGRPRQPGRLDWPGGLDLPPAPVPLLTAALTPGALSPVWVAGGEPTLRRDLPEVIHAMAQVHAGPLGLETDGLALTRSGAIAPLVAAGLSRVRIPLHSLHADAHDWLVGQPGAARRARRAMAACATAGLRVHAEVCLTRPTTDHLPDTIKFLARMGVAAIHLRRPRRRGPAAAAFVTISPRLGLLEPYLHGAIAAGRELGLRVRVHGVPRCGAPRAPRSAFESDREGWLVPGFTAYDHLRTQLSDGFEGACSACPGTPACGGVPRDYAQRFGRGEFESELALPATRPSPLPPTIATTPPAPPPRGLRTPATRLRAVVDTIALGNLGGDPMAGRAPGSLPSHAQLRLMGPTRALRQELVRLAQIGTATLVIDDRQSTAHPRWALLIREAVRLGFTTLALPDDLAPLSDMTDRELVALRGLLRVRARVRPDQVPDAARVTRLAGAQIEPCT